MSSNFLVFHTTGGISSSPAAFLFLIFLSSKSSSSCVNCPSLMSCRLLIIFAISSSVIFGGFISKFSKCFFPPVYSFFFVGSFQLSSRSTLPSTHFVYCLPCYPRLSIFNQISNLIDLILYVFCLFFYVYVSSFCAFLSFSMLVLVGFLLLHRNAVFTCARLFSNR